MRKSYMTGYSRKICGIALCVFSLSTVNAQYVTNYLKAADDFYRKGDYYSAARNYEKYLDALPKARQGYDPYAVQSLAKRTGLSEERTRQVMYQIAESYRELSYYTKAEPFYSQVVQSGTTNYPLAVYGYGVTLRSLQKYEDAERMISTFLQNYPTKDQYSEAAVRELKNLQFVRQQLSRTDLGLYRVQKGDALLNTTGANYAPVFFGKDRLAFTSTRPDSSRKNAAHLNRLFLAMLNADGSAGNVQPLPLPASKLHQGTAALSADGNTLYFTAWQAGDKDKKAVIYRSVKAGEEWSDPEPLGADVNVEGASAQQPFVTADGRTLVFSSDRPGGKGGFDIWFAPLGSNGATSGPAQNLGAINSPGDEQAPYYHEASHTLVFSSDGRIGMGGFDLFFSKGNFAQATQTDWSEPENFGHPVNSIKDDIYFASRGGKDNILEEVWLSSDRSAECCLELFSLSKHVPKPEPVVVKTEEKKPEPEKPVLPPPGKAEVLSNVYYEYNKSELLDGSYASLDKLVAMLKENPGMEIEISGHTDNKGSDAYNDKLSLQRAQKCVEYIVSKGIEPARVTAKGYGARKPVAPNEHPDGTDNPEGRQQNRRTEFMILKK